MVASANFTANGASVPPELAVAASSLVTLALLSVSGVNTITWTILGNHAEAAANPTITSAGTPLGATATFTMPSGVGQAYLIQGQINGGVDSEGTEQTGYTKTAIVGVLNAAGVVPFAFGETFERSATHGTTEALNTLVAQTAGVDGQPGGDTFQFTYSATTTDADPGAGVLRLSSGTYSAVTQVYVDLLNSAGIDVAAWLDSFDDAGGRIKLFSVSDPTKFVIFDVASVTTASGYRKIGVAYVTHNGTLTTTVADTALTLTGSGGDSVTFGTALTDANQTLTVVTGNDGSKLLIPLTGARTKTLSPTGAVNGSMRTIENSLGGATFALTVANGGIEGGTFVVANARWARFKFGTGQWGLDGEGGL